MHDNPPTPRFWLGTRMAAEALNTGSPYTDLDHARNEGEARLRRLSGLVAQMVFEVDWLDEEAEMQRRDLVRIVNDRRWHTGRPSNEAGRARAMAPRVEAVYAHRDRSVKFLRRLLPAYRDAASDTP